MTLQILIVDDDPQIAEIHRHFTEKVDGFGVCGIAGNLEDAEKMSTLLKPDLILLDLYLPEGKGTQILWNLRARHQATDVILITAAKELEPLQEAIHGGVFDYILKPVMFQRFKEALERFRDYRLRMTAEATLDQHTVDRLLHPYKTATAGEPIYPKGIDALTLKKIQAVFVQPHPQGLSAEEVAAMIGAGRTTARRYLEYLVAHNELITELVYGTVGRPERRYFKQHVHPST
ncbi:response regulator [Pelovirga terrestris]|uniref:Transcriptional regulatory protein n=1 Tax=Pelovirga terrestris TaxID=2771352 RepID=A0A8J6QQJ8_9BACT|nr:response regulator [Pelovirga terrestris]MBD1399955.1 response regulator [Pelovirga terrestris]